MTNKLHQALEALQPRDWSEVASRELDAFLAETFSQAELICDSVPSAPGGSDFLSSSLTLKTVNGATKASEMVHSTARAPAPPPDIADLQKAWGKPLKVNAKDNPLGVTMYKMAGHDRHGAWFARRSVHEGLGFERWKKAMQKEFPKSLAVQGTPGEGSVRGIGADVRLENLTGEAGKLEVYQLSAQFPGPVAPREFVTCLLTTDNNSESQKDYYKDSKSIARQYMVVSIPVDHPEAPVRNGLVRGQYESVEMIREIPLTQPKSVSTPNLLGLSSDKDKGRSRGRTIGFAESRVLSAKGEQMDRMSSKSEEIGQGKSSSDDPESNPVEWTMITRSDPGGGIPRFMVERGTPSSITSDAAKFIDWAATQHETPSDDEEMAAQEDGKALSHHRPSLDYSVAAGGGHLAGVAAVDNKGVYEPSTPGETGIIASLTNIAQAGIESYAPNIVQNNMPNFMRRDLSSDSDSDSDTASFNSFASATADFKTAREGSRSPDPLSYSTSDVSLMPDDSSGATGKIAGEDTQYEREIAKLEQKRRTLDEKMMKSREREKERTSELSQKEEKDAEKQREKIERDKRRQEERYAKELRKLEERREKEARRLENRHKKAREKDILSKTTRERDEYRRQLEILRRENELLRRQMGELQRENTLFVQKAGKTEAGISALRQMREEFEVERKRASSVGSKSSIRSIGRGSGDLPAS